MESDQDRMPEGRRKPWVADLFAVAATLITLGLRLALRDQLRDRPTLIVFTVPIMLSAYFGGRRSGLLATALSYVGASFFLIPPFRSFRVASAVDRWDLFFLVLAGVAISMLNEALHRARRRAAIATGELQTRVALVKAEALQTAIFNSVNFSSIATDEKGIIQIFNVGAERMLGYTAAEVVNKLTPADISDPQEMIARSKALSAEMGTPISPGLETLVYKASRGIEYIYEPTFIRKDGTRFPAVVSVAALRDAGEAIIGYLLIGTDNTARKQAEEARLASEARYRTLFEYAPDGIVIADAKSNYLDANPSVCQLLGFSHAEFIRMKGADIVAPADLHRVGETLRAVNAHCRYEREWQFRRKDGSLVSAEVLATLMPDGNVMAVIRDITARKQAEAALLKAGALQRAIFDSANFSSIATDAKGVIQIFNVGAERMLGYTAAEVMNKITPADISDPQEVIARAQALTLELGTPITPGFDALVFKASRGIEDIYELTYVRKDESRFPAVVSVTALRDAQDAIIGYLLIGTDNTARKQAEAAKQAIEASYRTLFEYAPDGIVIADAQSNYLDANPSICNLLGYTREELIGMNAADIVAPAEIPFIGEALGVIHSKSAYEREWRFRRKDGSLVSAEVLATMMPDGTLMGVIRDITARKRVDDALRKSEAQLHTILENISEAVVVSDLDGKLLHFNHAALGMMGYASLDQGRRQFSELADTFELSSVDGQDWSVAQWPMARILRGEELHDLEARMRRIHTPWDRVYSFGGTIAHDPDGKPLMAIVTFSDITERKLAAEEIRKLNFDLEKRVEQRTAQLQTANESLYVSEERYRSLVDSAKEYAILTLDTQGCITTWNAGAKRIKGYRAEEIIGRNFSCFYPAEDVRRGKPQTELKEATEVGQFEEDGWRVRKDGSVYWANVLITVLRDSHGNHLGFSKIVRDLTLRKQAEEKLRVSEEWLRSLVEGGKKYAIITLDTQGNITTWNAGAERIKGYRADEVVGKHFSCFYTPEDVKLGKPQRELKVAAETGQYEEDGWRVRKDGSRLWVNVLISSLRDSHGKHLGFSKITRDLTDIMKAEEQARNFFTMSLELLCIAGVDGYFKVLNPAWENTLGYTQTELCAKPFYDFVHADDLPATFAATQRITAAEPLNHFENRYRCKDGSYRWLLWKVALSADLQLMHCAATDITQLKQTTGEIAGLNKALQLQNLELATANKELEAFSYSVSHDLRAPLRSIDGFSKAILEDYTDKLDSTGQDYLQRVRASSQRMGQLIDDMLNLSRVSRGDLLHETTDLSRIAREVIDECRASSKEREVKVEITEGMTVEADPRLMRIVLTNLLGNAWKFTGKTVAAVIEFGCSSENGEYFVHDNGAGFDMAYVDKLFGAFQRLHSDKDFPGTGIGLATIQRIIHRHGGQVRAASKPGEGATFYFTLKHQAGVNTPALQSAT